MSWETSPGGGAEEGVCGGWKGEGKQGVSKWGSRTSITIKDGDVCI